MTEPDDAIAWAIKQAEVNAGFGRAWHYKDVCHAYRAGHAARDAEVETLRARVAEVKRALQWAMDDIDGRTRYPGSDVATPDEQRENCYAIAEAALKGAADGRD